MYQAISEVIVHMDWKLDIINASLERGILNIWTY